MISAFTAGCNVNRATFRFAQAAAPPTAPPMRPPSPIRARGNSDSTSCHQLSPRNAAQRSPLCTAPLGGCDIVKAFLAKSVGLRVCHTIPGSADPFSQPQAGETTVAEVPAVATTMAAWPARAGTSAGRSKADGGMRRGSARCRSSRWPRRSWIERAGSRRTCAAGPPRSWLRPASVRPPWPGPRRRRR